MGKRTILERTAPFLCIILVILLASCNVRDAFEIPEGSMPSSSVTVEGSASEKVFSYEDIPPYMISPFVTVNGGSPYFIEDDMDGEGITLSPLDELGRPGPAVCIIGKENIPLEERGEIGMVRPAGWQISKYDFIDGQYLYNRCHLLGYQLTGLNAEIENLMTGTRYLNVHGMLPFENEITHALRYSDLHVIYRVTPVYVDEEVLARGVLMEAWSIEDSGEKVRICVFCYNVQPGVEIDYSDGKNHETGTDHVLDMVNMIYHSKECSLTDGLREEDSQLFLGSESILKEHGFSPCSECMK